MSGTVSVPRRADKNRPENAVTPKSEYNPEIRGDKTKLL